MVALIVGWKNGKIVMDSGGFLLASFILAALVFFAAVIIVALVSAGIWFLVKTIRGRAFVSKEKRKVQPVALKK